MMRFVGARVAVVLAAAALDGVFGEPPPPLHPVVWIGRALAWLESKAPERGDTARFGYGLVVAVGLPAFGAVVSHALERLPWPLQALALKPAFAGRALLKAGGTVRDALAEGELERARTEMASLVSRRTTNLDGSLVAAAAIESLAENLTDSWVAPLLAYSVGGLGGAYALRCVNTADAMWGYRGVPYEWLGKAAARLDDAAMWLPARVAALCLLACRPAAAREGIRAWRVDAGRTVSPNAGQTMALTAGLLGVRLVKEGHYCLNGEGRPPSADDLDRALRLVTRAMGVALVPVLGLAFLMHRHRGSGRGRLS